MLLIFSLFSDCRKCSLMYLFVSCNMLNALLIFFSSSPPGLQCSVIFYFVCNFISSLCNNGERGGRGDGGRPPQGRGGGNRQRLRGRGGCHGGRLPPRARPQEECLARRGRARG